MQLITRGEWGALSPRSSPTRLSSAKRIFIHYTGMDADEQADHANCFARVRGIQRYHLFTKKWNDIAYSFIPCKHGFVFEGRGLGIHTAATGPCNFDSHAICFLGDDSEGRDDATDLGRKAIAEMVERIERVYGAQTVHGHRNCMTTACPGDELYSWLRAGLPLPKPPPPEPEDDLPYTPAELRDIFLDALESDRGREILQLAIESIPINDRVNNVQRELRTILSYTHANSARIP